METAERVDTIVEGMFDVFTKQRKGEGITFKGAADLLTIMENCPVALRKEVMEKFDAKVEALGA